MKQFFFSSIWILAGVYAVLGGWLFYNQRSLLYFPDPSTPSPAAAGFPDMEVVRFKTADGLTLSAWYKPAAAGQATIVYFHGNAGSLLNHSWIARPFLDAGYGMLLVEYRGYGGNAGTPTEDGLYYDGTAAIEFLKGLGVAGQDLVLFGQSLGTGVAVEMATRFKAKALILQSPYTSIPDVGQFHYWYMPVKWLAKDRFDSASKISRVEAPLLVTYARDDVVVPAKFSVALFDLALEPKTLIAIEGAGHNDLGDAGGLEVVLEFLKTLEEKVVSPAGIEPATH